MSALRLALAQPEVRVDPRENGATVRRLMRAAASGGARMVQFPEGTLSGYAKAQVESWEDVDFGAVREELEAVAALADELSIWVVLGSAHALTPPHRPHNSLYVIADDGRIVTRYDKRLLSNTEVTRFYTPGFEPVVFEVDGYRFGLAICVEINFPDLFIEYEQLGVDCVLLSAYPVDSIFATKARGHAAIHNYWVAMSIPAQSTGLFLSGLLGPNGQVARRGRGDGRASGGSSRPAGPGQPPRPDRQAAVESGGSRGRGLPGAPGHRPAKRHAHDVLAVLPHPML